MRSIKIEAFPWSVWIDRRRVLNDKFWPQYIKVNRERLFHTLREVVVFHYEKL